MTVFVALLMNVCEQMILEKYQRMYKLAPHGGFTVGNLKHDPDGLKFHTSLEIYRVFFNALASLGPAASELTYLKGVQQASSEPNQIFMYLIELGRLKPNFQLGRLFTTYASDAYWIFATWICITSLQCHEIYVGPSRGAINIFPL